MRNTTITEDLEAIVEHDLPWSNFEGRTILISGANGFLPAYMVETILYLNETRFKTPARILGLVRNRARAEERFAHHHGRTDLHLLVQDVCDPVTSAEKIDYIIHAASQASPKYFGTDPVGTLSANVLGTYQLLQVAREHGAQAFLFFSSGEVYGEVDQSQVPTREDNYGFVNPTNVRSCYAESKRVAETMCIAWHHQYGLPTRVVRPFHTYGPGMALNDGRVFADFVADIVNDRDIVMKSDGSARRAFCYLADAVAGFFTVLFKGENGQSYNIGYEGGETSIFELARTLAGLFPEKNLQVIRQERQQPQSYLASSISRNCPDTTKARALGWQPRTSLREGFTRTIRSFQ